MRKTGSVKVRCTVIPIPIPPIVQTYSTMCLHSFLKCSSILYQSLLVPWSHSASSHTASWQIRPCPPSLGYHWSFAGSATSIWGGGGGRGGRITTVTLKVCMLAPSWKELEGDELLNFCCSYLLDQYHQSSLLYPTYRAKWNGHCVTFDPQINIFIPWSVKVLNDVWIATWSCLVVLPGCFTAQKLCSKSWNI